MSTTLTDITVVLDRSSSMNSTKESTINGFNEFLSQQKADQTGRCTFSLTDFSTVITERVVAQKIGEVSELTNSTYRPAGMTALYDAIGMTINTINNRIATLKRRKKKSPDKVIVVVITDGMENASREFNGTAVNKLINEHKEKNWEFVFIGANQDSIRTARLMGIDQGSSLTYAQNAVGTRAAFASAAAATSNVRSAVSKGVLERSYEFTENDRKKQYAEGARDELFEGTW